MEWKTFGALLRALRAQVPLVFTGNEWADTPVVRKHLSRWALIGDVTIHYTQRDIYNTLVDLELGRVRELNARRRHILLALTEVLRFTRTEREELLALANGIPEEDVPWPSVSKSQALNHLKQMVAHMQVPAFVCDGLGNLLLANSAVIQLYGGERLQQLYWEMLAQVWAKQDKVEDPETVSV